MPSSIYAPRASVQGLPPDTLTVEASLTTPWRRAVIDAQALSGSVTATRTATDTPSAVFTGEVDHPEAIVRDVGRATARGLPEWRRDVGPLTFQDVRLETVLGWIAGRCGGNVQVQARGAQRRHYVLRRGPAWQLAREALAAWNDASELIELDGGVLYIGAEAQSPHALAEVQATARRGENIIDLTATGAGTWRVMVPLTPHLRVGHRLDLDHPLVSGSARIVQATHTAGRHNTTRLEVIDL